MTWRNCLVDSAAWKVIKNGDVEVLYHDEDSLWCHVLSRFPHWLFWWCLRVPMWCTKYTVSVHLLITIVQGPNKFRWPYALPVNQLWIRGVVSTAVVEYPDLLMLNSNSTLSLPVTRMCVNFSTVYNDTLVAKGLIIKARLTREQRLDLSAFVGGSTAWQGQRESSVPPGPALPDVELLQDRCILASDNWSQQIVIGEHSEKNKNDKHSILFI